MNSPRRDGERGSALITVLMLAALMSALLTAYYLLTWVESSTTQYTMNSSRGFYAAEAGLNIRAEAIRQRFLGFNLPTGTPPTVTAGQLPCRGLSQGSGDFRCDIYNFPGRDVITYVSEEPGNPLSIVIPPGEAYQNLNAQEYTYDASSISANADDRPEAILDMKFKSRVVPMFQFAAFFNKDLEITPGPPLTLSGPVHSNWDIYTAADTTVDIEGDITLVGDLYRGRKEGDICWTGPVRVLDPVNPTELPQCSGGRRLIPQPELAPWNGHILSGVEPVTVPQPDALDPLPGKIYWDRADLRVILDLRSGTPTVRAVRADDTDHPAAAQLASCGNPITNSNSFYNNREGQTIKILDVDVGGLMDCLQTYPALIDGKPLDETSEGGLVFYFGVRGPLETGFNDYGVRVVNADVLAASPALAPPEIKGLTIVSNQALYVQGHYNRLSKKPAAILADSMNVLSEAWNNDSDSTNFLYGGTRRASPTTINAAFLAGTDTTGGLEGPPGQNSGNYSGGLHNFKRMHEDWRNVTLTYRGSLVSLNNALHVNGGLIVGSPQYSPPIRDFDYDTDFNDVDKLPPLSPVFVYLKQELFVREFDL